jgi:hypothetical protein
MGKVSSALGAVEIGATALWVGASAGFAFVYAPIAFKLVTDRDTFAEITGQTLARLAALTFAAGGAAVGAAFLRAAVSPEARKSDVIRALVGSAALAAVAYHETAVVPAMNEAQRAMGGSFKAVAEDDPARIAYRKKHEVSRSVYGGALLLGVTQLLLAATRSGKPPAS